MAGEAAQMKWTTNIMPMKSIDGLKAGAVHVHVPSFQVTSTRAALCLKDVEMSAIIFFWKHASTLSTRSGASWPVANCRSSNFPGEQTSLEYLLLSSRMGL